MGGTNIFKNTWFIAFSLWIFILAALLTTRYSYSQLLPSKFSNQDEINPDTINEDYDPNIKEAIFNNELLTNIPLINSNPRVLAATDSTTKESDKRIEVDLTNQMVYAYEGDKLVYEFKTSTGKWGKTPTGEFQIWIKLKSTRMSGGSKELGTYYNLPNVPYTMYFYNDEIPAARGFGIHGAYWHNNFGHPMSHGCVNLSPEDAEKLYYWANPELGEATSIKATKDNPGTKIIIYGKAPNY